MHKCKQSICASGWKEKHHQCKLQWVMTTTCASEVFAPVDGRKSPPVQSAKVSTSTKASWMWQQHATTITTTTHQIRTSTGAVGVPDAAISATCVRAYAFTFYFPLCELCTLGFADCSVRKLSTHSSHLKLSERFYALVLVTKLPCCCGKHLLLSLPDIPCVLCLFLEANCVSALQACVCVCCDVIKMVDGGHTVSRGTPEASNLHHDGMVTADGQKFLCARHLQDQRHCSSSATCSYFMAQSSSRPTKPHKP